MITILRLGHRIPRDKRITTHVALVARALGADRMLVSTEDTELERTVKKVVKRFGGEFELETGCNWKKVMSSWSGKIVHLTMYGERLDDVLPRIPKNTDLLIVVGAEKMPSEVFEKADYNVAVGNQPHSEVAALAVFLDRFFGGSSIQKDFQGELEIVASPTGKNVSKKLPTRAQCLKMLEDAGCDEATIEHSVSVNKLAVKLGKLCNADIELVNVASLLHDIGRSKGHNIMHGVEGARILQRLNLPKEVVLITEKHIGAGLDKEDAKEVGLPQRDYIPRTLEEKIVCHADNLIAHNKKIPLKELLKLHEKEGLIKSVRRLKKLHKELSDICGIDLDEISLD
jgi:tRNA (cytidine56-2'-O)-methyltransferase